MSQAIAKPSRVRDPKLLARVREGRCVVCGVRGSDPDHIQTRGAGGGDTEDNLVPLCRKHHIQRHARGWSRFVELHPFLVDVLLEKGWTIREVLGRKKLTRV